MLIYQKLKGKWNKEKSKYEFPLGQEKLLYRGKFANAFGGGGSTQEVVATGPWEQQIPYIQQLFDQASKLYANGPPSYYPGQLTPDVNPTLANSWNQTNAAVGNNVNTNNAVQGNLYDTAMRAGSNPVAGTAAQVNPYITPGISSLVSGQNASATAGGQTAPGMVSTLNNFETGNTGIQQLGSAALPRISSGIDQLISGQNAAENLGGALSPAYANSAWSLLAGADPLQTTGRSVAPGVSQSVGQLLGPNAASGLGMGLAPAIGQGVYGATAGLPGTQFGGMDASHALSTALNSNGLNPYTDQIVQAALRSSNDQFNTNILPAIRTEGNSANQYGGTRHGIAEGIATRGLQQQQGDIISRLYGQAFDVGSADRNAALGLVGNAQQAEQQAELQRRNLGLQGAQIGSSLINSGADLSGRNAAAALSGISGLLGAGTDATLQAGQQASGLVQSGADLTQRGVLGGTQLGSDILNSGANLGLQAASQAGNLVNSGANLTQQGISTGTAQAGNLLTAGNAAAMDQYYRSLGLLPQYQANSLAQIGFQNQSGLQQYGIGQAGIDANMDRYFYNMLAPYNALTQFQNFISGPYGSSIPQPPPGPAPTPQNPVPGGPFNPYADPGTPMNPYRSPY